MEDNAYRARPDNSNRGSNPLFRGILGLLLLPLSVSLISPTSLEAATLGPLPAFKIIFSDGEQNLSDLVIGDDLWVQVRNSGYRPELTLSLFDDQGTLVTSKQVAVGPGGHTEASLLWFRSGVVGCDDPSEIDPAAHRYPDFDVAELLLTGRTFEVRVEDDAGHTLGTRSLALTVAHEPRYFFSNIWGCPRSLFEAGESIYLSARDADPGSSETTLYMVDPLDPISPTGEVQEIRDEYQDDPQTLDPITGQGDWTLKMWSGSAAMPGRFGGLVEHVCTSSGIGILTQTCSHSVGAFEDDGKSEHGITIQDWSCETEGCDL